MTQGFRPTEPASGFPWPLTFSSFAFGVWVFNTLQANVIFQSRQFVPEEELLQPSGRHPSPDWKDRWSASFIVAEDMMPPAPVEIVWRSLDGTDHAAVLDLINDIFPGREVRHNVTKAEVNEDWARYDKAVPDILLEVNDRTINVYMRATVLTKLASISDRPDNFSREDLVSVWTRTF